MENEGLFHATLGLDFTVEEMHYERSSYHRKRFVEPPGDNRNQAAISGERELWVKCEATMPPLGANKTVYPFTRNVFLGSLAQSFNRFDSILSSSSASSTVTPFLSRVKCRSYKFNRKFDNYYFLLHKSPYNIIFSIDFDTYEFILICFRYLCLTSERMARP